MARTYLQYLQGCTFNTAVSRSGIVQLADVQPDDLVAYAIAIHEGRDPGEEPQVSNNQNNVQLDNKWTLDDWAGVFRV